MIKKTPQTSSCLLELMQTPIDMANLKVDLVWLGITSNLNCFSWLVGIGVGLMKADEIDREESLLITGSLPTHTTIL
jgi:hypothetical protein